MRHRAPRNSADRAHQSIQLARAAAKCSEAEVRPRTLSAAKPRWLLSFHALHCHGLHVVLCASECCQNALSPRRGLQEE
eukprot:5362676-Alexandrium_andersonii.AAC.1